MSDPKPAEPRIAAGNLETAARIREVYERDGPWGVLERYEEFFHPDAVWEPAVSAFGSAAYTGRAGMERWIRDMEAIATEFTQVIATVEAVGERHVLASGTMQIVGKESGLAFEGDYAQLWEVVEGRMKSMRAYLSHAEAEAATRKLEEAGEGSARSHVELLRGFWALFNDDSFAELLSRYEEFFAEDLEWNTPVSMVAPDSSDTSPT